MLTSGSIKTLVTKLHSTQNRLANVREKADEMMHLTLQAAEVSGSAFGISYANERFGQGELKIAGLPADLIGGVALHGVALLGGVSGKYADHVHNLADGLLASYAVRQGAAMGRKGASTGFQPAGAFRGGSTGYQPASAYAGFQPASSYAGR